MLDWIRDYRKEWVAPDLLAGLTTAAVVVPMAMAYATIAGVPLQVGLYTALVPMLVYAAVGSSRALSVSTTSTIAILVGAELGQLGVEGRPAELAGALAALTLLVGAILVAASVLHLGFVANFISHPVLLGFKAGIGLVIVIDQLPKLLGIAVHKGSFLHNVLGILEGLPHASPMTLAVGLATIALVIAGERWLPRGLGPLLAVAAGIAGVEVLGLQQRGVLTVGHIPEGLPSLTPPDLPLLEHLWPAALGIALMSFTETIAAGRAFAADDEPNPVANRELLATGLASVGGALFGAMPAGGGTSQTAVNRSSGARTPLASLATAGVALVTMFFLAPTLESMPQATLAAVVLLVAARLIQPAEFEAVLEVRRMEFVWILVAFAGVVLLGTLKGIVVAIVVSLLGLAYQLANPPVYVLGRKPGTNVYRPASDEHPDDERFPGLLLLRLEGRVFFVNAERIAEKIRAFVAPAEPRVLALDMSAVHDLEFTALKMLTEAERRGRERGILLWLAGLQPEVLRMIQHSPLGRTLGRERMFFDLEQAVSRYQAMSHRATP